MHGSALKNITSNLEPGLQLPLPGLPGGEHPWETSGIEAALGSATSRAPSGCAGAAREAVRLSHLVQHLVNRARSATMGH